MHFVLRILLDLWVLTMNSYGASDGYPSQQGITRDAQVCFLDSIIICVLNVFDFFNFLLPELFVDTFTFLSRLP